MSKKYQILIILLLLGSFSHLYPQATKARIENVDFFVIDEKIMVSYDLVRASSQETFNLTLECVTQENEIIIPVTLEGEIGEGVKPGKGKKVYWDVFNDVDEISGEISFRISIASVERIYGGPGNAAYSVLVPGLGDYYVADPSTMKIKPYYRTVAAYGLVGYGLIERINANNKFDDYNNSTNRDEFDELYDKANKANHRSQIAIGMGLAVWTFDVIWVIIKGSKNNKENKYRFQGNVDGGLMLGYDEHGMNVKYVFKF